MHYQLLSHIHKSELHDRPITIIALDPGTKHLGVSILRSTLNGTPELLSSQTIVCNGNELAIRATADEHGELVARIYYLVDKLMDIVLTEDVDYIVSESPYMGRFAASFAALTTLLSLIRYRVFRDTDLFRLHTLTPSTVKEHMGVKGTSGDKDLMTNALLKHNLITDVDIESLDEHAIDATCVGLKFLSEIT